MIFREPTCSGWIFNKLGWISQELEKFMQMEAQLFLDEGYISERVEKDLNGLTLPVPYGF